MDSTQYKSRTAAEGVVKCVDGVAEVGSDSFKCSKVRDPSTGLHISC